MVVLPKRIFISFIFSFILCFLKGQNVMNESRFLKFDVKELRYKLEKDRYAESGLIVLGYRGRLLGGVNALLNVSSARMCYPDFLPNTTIDYKIQYCNDSLIDAKLYILKTLSDAYKFDILDTIKLTETYKLTIINASKLVKSPNDTVNYQQCGFSNLKMRSTYDGDFKLHKYMCLKCLAEIFEINLNVIVNVDLNDNNDYDFVLPGSMSFLTKFAENPNITIESINEYFTENYGLKLIKETRMEKLKLIKFRH